MNLRSIQVFLFALILSALRLPLLAPAQEQKAAQEDEIREAIVRYQIANWDLRADVYFIEIQSKDPSKDFLQRFVDLSKPVNKNAWTAIVFPKFPNTGCLVSRFCFMPIHPGVRTAPISSMQSNKRFFCS